MDRLTRRDEALALTYTLAQRFIRLMHERLELRLDAWIEDVAQSGAEALQRFALGLRDDYEAVRAGLAVAYSNGQTEGQGTRHKLTRGTTYGRGKFDLLQHRVLNAA